MSSIELFAFTSALSMRKRKPPKKRHTEENNRIPTATQRMLAEHSYFTKATNTDHLYQGKFCNYCRILKARELHTEAFDRPKLKKFICKIFGIISGNIQKSRLKERG